MLSSSSDSPLPGLEELVDRGPLLSEHFQDLIIVIVIVIVIMIVIVIVIVTITTTIDIILINHYLPEFPADEVDDADGEVVIC